MKGALVFRDKCCNTYNSLSSGGKNTEMRREGEERRRQGEDEMQRKETCPAGGF